MPGRVLGHDRYSCDNDMVCGWAGSLAGEDGINVISGTGSMTYGERQGTGHRVGGWGELFGDEGSAYWIATQGLNAFSRMSDGRLARGPLYELLKERLELAGDLDVVSLVIDTWGGNRTSIAALATTVCQAAREEDPVAAKILRRRRRRTGHADRHHPHAGRVRRRGDRAGVVLGRDVLRRRLPRAVPRPPSDGQPANYDLRRPLLDPALGAALYAAKHRGQPLSSDAVRQLSANATTFDEVRTP